MLVHRSALPPILGQLRYAYNTTKVRIAGSEEQFTGRARLLFGLKNLHREVQVASPWRDANADGFGNRNSR